MKTILFLLLTAATFCKGQGKLILPVTGGRFRPFVADINRPENKNLYLYPGQNHEVRSAEPGLVKAVAHVDSIDFLVVVQGKYSIYYSNLHRTYVKKGDKLKAGQVIGELQYAKGAPEAEALVMRIEKNGKIIVDPSVFKN